MFSGNFKLLLMKLYLSITIILLALISCGSKSPNEIEDLNADKVQLLVGDSAIFSNWVEEQNTKRVIPVGDLGVGFVDSTGHSAHKPMQIISFNKSEIDKLQNLISSAPKKLQPNEKTTCIVFYRYVFQWYKDDKLVKQISLSLGCFTLYIEPEKQTVEIGQNNIDLYNQLLSLLKNKNVYLDKGDFPPL